MNRLFYNSEAQIYNTIQRNVIQDAADRDRRIKIKYDLMRYNNKQSYMYPQDILFNADYKYNGMMGTLRLTRDTSKRGEYYLLNKYGEDFIAGNNGLVPDSVNKFRSNVSSYIVDNEAVKRQSPSIYKKGTFIIK